MRLIDADALRADYFVTSTTTNTPLYRYVSMEQIAIAPTVEPASPWHRVEERLPNVGELVVGLDADGHAEITMLSEAKCWLTYGLWIHNLGCYVWWMPLPEPPKED